MDVEIMIVILNHFFLCWFHDFFAVQLYLWNRILFVLFFLMHHEDLVHEYLEHFVKLWLIFQVNWCIISLMLRLPFQDVLILLEVDEMDQILKF